MKLSRISVGQKRKTSETPPGKRENLLLERGRYTIGVEYPLSLRAVEQKGNGGQWVNTFDEEIAIMKVSKNKDKEKKDKKIINEATHFVVYWCNDCIFSEKQKKIIGIYENKGLITIDSEEKYKENYSGIVNKLMSNEQFESTCHQYKTRQRKGWGAHLNKIYDGVLDFPEKVNVRGDFGNIINEKNIQYIQDKIDKIDEHKSEGE